MKSLTITDIADQRADLLPQRDTMLFDINVAPVVAVNLAIAVNAATWGSTANATALQVIGVLQH